MSVVLVSILLFAYGAIGFFYVNRINRVAGKYELLFTVMKEMRPRDRRMLKSYFQQLLFITLGVLILTVLVLFI